MLVSAKCKRRECMSLPPQLFKHDHVESWYGDSILQAGRLSRRLNDFRCAVAPLREKSSWALKSVSHAAAQRRNGATEDQTKTLLSDPSPPERGAGSFLTVTSGFCRRIQDAGCVCAARRARPQTP